MVSEREPFAARLETLLTDAGDLIAHAAERRRLRATEGRRLSKDTVERLRRLGARMDVLRAELDATLDADSPTIGYRLPE